MTYEVFTFDQRPEFRDQIDRISVESWPEFLRHGNTPHWNALFEVFPDSQVLLCEGDEVMAVGHTVPLVWDGTPGDLPTGIDDILLRALAAREQGAACRTQAALAAMVCRTCRGQGLSSELLRVMKATGAVHGAQTLIVPVRPTFKARYPLIPFEEYVRWQRPDGLPFDPWLRVHARLGAIVLAVAQNTLIVTGTVAEWEAWTGMTMMSGGDYIVDGALQPVKVDVDADVGRYEDPNLWMMHR